MRVARDIGSSGAVIVCHRRDIVARGCRLATRGSRLAALFVSNQFWKRVSDCHGHSGEAFAVERSQVRVATVGGG